MLIRTFGAIIVGDFHFEDDADQSKCVVNDPSAPPTGQEEQTAAQLELWRSCLVRNVPQVCP